MQGTDEVLRAAACHTAAGGAQLHALAHPTPDTVGLPHVEDVVQQRNWLCGTPQEAIAFLQELEAKYPGVERVILSFAMGTPQAVCHEQLRRFAAEVMPAFSGHRR
jgi:hypothetical protein